MKSVKQWLETIADEEIREKALSNMDDDGAKHKESLYNALFAAFTWDETPEGHQYWYDVAKLAFYEQLPRV